jgi:hypothetical protein
MANKAAVQAIAKLVEALAVDYEHAKRLKRDGSGFVRSYGSILLHIQKLQQRAQRGEDQQVSDVLGRRLHEGWLNETIPATPVHRYYLEKAISEFGMADWSR